MSRRTVLAPAARFRPVAAAVVLLVLPGCPDVGERSVDDAGFPALRTEVLVDDEDGEPGFSTTGDDWTTWGTNGYGFDGSDTSYHYLSHTLGGDDRRGTATWSPTLPEAGTYRIETWFRRTENRTDDTFGD
ncbi:MAG: hypothetical protein QGH45_25415, partial [Myxococcota bacterium]|nr:hypothetical protein [Myxococcota bacterium]